jgi:hypothetical protein
MSTRLHHQTLTAHLEGWDAGQLARLVQLRPDLLWPRPPVDLAELATRAHSQPSIVAAIRAATLPENRLMQVIVCCSPDLTDAELLDALPSGVTLADVEPVLAGLEAAALVWRHEGRIHVSGSLRQAMPTTLGPPVHHLVKDQPVDYLRHVIGNVRAIARVALDGALPPHATGPDGRPARKADVVDELTALLATPGVVEATLLAAPPEALQLARMQAFGRPAITMDRPLWFSPHQRISSPHQSPAVWLFEHGLLVPLRDDRQGWQPREVGLALRGGKPIPDLGLVPPTLDVADVDQAAVDRNAGERTAATLGRLADILDAWAIEPAQHLKSGGLGVTTMKQLAVMLDTDVEEAGRLVELLHLAGLVDPRTVTRKERRQFTSDTTMVPGRSAHEWTEQPAPERWLRLVRAWMRAEHWPSASGRKPEGGKAVPVTGHLPGFGASSRRADVLQAFALLPPGRATTPNALDAHVFWTRPQPWLDVRIEEPPVVIDWIVAEAELLGLVAGGALSTAGRRLLADDADGALGALAHALPPEGRTFTLQADLTATVFGRLERDVLAELRLLADVEGTGAATTFRFSDASLRRGLDRGRSRDDMQAFLEDHAAKGVPPALTYLVGDVARRHGHLKVGTAKSYITSADPAALADACSHKGTRKVALRLLAPTVAVSPHPPAAVIAALREAGFLPTADADDPAVVKIDAEVTQRFGEYHVDVRSDTGLAERFVVREHGHPPMAPVDPETAAELAARWAARRPRDGLGRPQPGFRPRTAPGAAPGARP